MKIGGHAVQKAGLLAAILTLLLAAMAFAGTPKNALVVATSIDDMITLDPAETFEFTGQEVIANLYDRIMMYEAEDTSKLVGGVAESWDVSSDGMTITFKVRDGLTFHSGNPVRAEDAVFSLRRVIKLNLTPAFIFQQFGWTPENIDALVKVTEPGHFSVTIKEQFAPSMVLNCFAAGIGSVVDKKEAMAHAKEGDLGHAWLKRNDAGSGPYALKAWKPNNAVVLQANAAHRFGEPAMKRVILRHINEANSQRLLLEKGDVDMARGLNTDQVDKLKANDGIVVDNFPQAAVHFIGLNQKSDKLSNPKVWEALKWLVDYEGMAQSFLRGQYMIHQSFWPKGFPGALLDTPYALNVEKAKKLLAEAGYPQGFSVNMDVINNPVFMNMAQSIQQNFAKAGVKVNIIPGTGSQVITKYRSRTHELILIYWGPDFNDIHSNAASFAYNKDNSDSAKVSSSAWRNAWDMPELSKLTAAASVEKDGTKREDLYLGIQKSVQKSAPYVIMFQASSQIAMKKGVKGFVAGPTTDTVFYRNVTKN